MAKTKVIDTPRSHASMYLAKSQQFLEHAQLALASRAQDAAMLGAIHAAISAADAVCVALAGRRSGDTEDDRCADLLSEVAGGGARSHVGQFKMLISRKNVVEYEARRASAREANEAVRRAGRLVAWADKVVDKARTG